MRIIGGEAQLTREDFCDLSKSTGLLLPSEFVDFYLENNGGYPDVDPGGVNPLLLNCFLSIRYGDVTIGAAYQALVRSNPALDGCIPFAYDDSGNIFLLSAKADETGVIYLWFPGEGELETIFGSFTEFLRALLNGQEDT